MLAPWKESYDKPRQCIKSRTFTLPTKVHIVKAMVFPVVMYGCESWTIKKTEHQRIDDFELWCWRRLLRVSWTRRSNQSIVKEINPEYSLEGLTLKLKLQYFDYLMRRTNSFLNTWCQERLRVGEEGVTEDEIVGWHHQVNGLSKLWEIVKTWKPVVMQFMGSERVG